MHFLLFFRSKLVSQNRSDSPQNSSSGSSPVLSHSSSSPAPPSSSPSPQESPKNCSYIYRDWSDDIASIFIPLQKITPPFTIPPPPQTPPPPPITSSSAFYHNCPSLSSSPSTSTSLPFIKKLKTKKLIPFNLGKKFNKMLRKNSNSIDPKEYDAFVLRSPHEGWEQNECL